MPRYVAADTVLEQDVRRRLYDLVSGRPGLTPTVLAGELGVGLSTVGWHLRKLVRAGLLVGRVELGLRMYYSTAGGVAEREKGRAAVALRLPCAQAAYAYIRSHPQANVAQVAQACGMSTDAARSTARRLADMGLVSIARQGRRLMFAIRPGVPVPIVSALIGVPCRDVQQGLGAGL